MNCKATKDFQRMQKSEHSVKTQKALRKWISKVAIPQLNLQFRSPKTLLIGCRVDCSNSVLLILYRRI